MFWYNDITPAQHQKMKKNILSVFENLAQLVLSGDLESFSECFDNNSLLIASHEKYPELVNHIFQSDDKVLFLRSILKSSSDYVLKNKISSDNVIIPILLVGFQKEYDDVLNFLSFTYPFKITQKTLVEVFLGRNSYDNNHFGSSALSYFDNDILNFLLDVSMARRDMGKINDCLLMKEKLSDSSYKRSLFGFWDGEEIFGEDFKKTKKYLILFWGVGVKNLKMTFFLKFVFLFSKTSAKTEEKTFMF